MKKHFWHYHPLSDTSMGEKLLKVLFPKPWTSLGSQIIWSSVENSYANGDKNWIPQLTEYTKLNKIVSITFKLLF